jgi:acetylornithine deacetylase/succinyl-diaminopimelate desuccinylase-like protein
LAIDAFVANHPGPIPHGMARGHNAQVGHAGRRQGLQTAAEHLAGRATFFAVPPRRGDRVAGVQARGRLSSGGKAELLRLGHFDDVDLAMMIHLTPRAEDGKASVPLSNNGRVGKLARYIGKAAHAGGAPHLGINALYAAHIGLMAINALRETFRDEDTIRVHPILTAGGSQVNVIPAEARIQTYVRGRTLARSWRPTRAWTARFAPARWRSARGWRSTRSPATSPSPATRP